MRCVALLCISAYTLKTGRTPREANVIIWYAYQHEPKDCDTRTVCAPTKRELMERMASEPAGTWSFGKRDLGSLDIYAVCKIVESLESQNGLPSDGGGADRQISFG